MIPTSTSPLMAGSFLYKLCLIVSTEKCGCDQKILSLCASSINALSSGERDSLMWIPALSLGIFVALSQASPVQTSYVKLLIIKESTLNITVITLSRILLCISFIF